MHAGATRKEVIDYLKEYGDKASVTGIYKKWIILTSMLKGDKVFASIKEKDFIK